MYRKTCRQGRNRYFGAPASRCSRTTRDAGPIWPVSLWAQERIEEALEATRQAEVLHSKDDGEIETFVRMAILMTELGRDSEAANLLEHELPGKPDPMGHFIYGHVEASLRRVCGGLAAIRVSLAD